MMQEASENARYSKPRPAVAASEPSTGFTPGIAYEFDYDPNGNGT
jgi:hypothetical protein